MFDRPVLGLFNRQIPLDPFNMSLVVNKGLVLFIFNFEGIRRPEYSVNEESKAVPISIIASVIVKHLGERGIKRQ